MIKKIDFSRFADRMFTRVFFKIRKAQHSGKRFAINYGGAGSSKSVSQHQRELMNLLTADYDILIMRKVGADIFDSSYKLLENLAKAWKIYNLFDWTYSQGKRQIVNRSTGHRIFFRGADDIGKLKSIVGVKRVILEEADQFEFNDFKEINRRIRGIPGLQIVFILNPVDEDHWIKLYFYDDPNPDNPMIGIYRKDTFIIHSTYLNNPFLTQEDIDALLILKDVDENDYNIYALGKWGRLKTGGEFYPNFSEVKHVAKLQYNRNLPIHATYDFNVVPYMTLLLIQYIETKEEILFCVFQEYCLSTPRNSTEAITGAFVDDYEKFLTDIFYYGDASGANRIAGQGDKVNYDDVRKVLFKWIDPASDRVSRQNKPIMKRRKLLNTCFAGKLFMGRKKIRIIIDPSCTNTVKDMKYMKLGQNGKLVEKAKDPKTGVEYVKFGHTSDALEYCFCYLFADLL